MGPLSLAETRKLIWRLEGLDTLSGRDRIRAYTDVGGHPRALEYLDALLRGNTGRFTDVVLRLEKTLRDKGVADPSAWLEGVGGDLDRALSETVTLAADDVLLDTLLAGIEAIPPQRLAPAPYCWACGTRLASRRHGPTSWRRGVRRRAAAAAGG